MMPPPLVSFPVTGIMELSNLIEVVQSNPGSEVSLHCETTKILQVLKDAQRFRVIVEALLVGTPESLEIIERIAAKDADTFDELRAAIDEAIKQTKGTPS